MNNFIHHCPGTLWKFLCGSVTQLHPEPKATWEALASMWPHGSQCPSWEGPLMSSMVLANHFLSVWQDSKQSSWHFTVLDLKEQERLGFPSPVFSDSLTSVSFQRSQLHGVQALPGGLTDKQVGSWHGTVLFANEGKHRMRAGGQDPSDPSVLIEERVVIFDRGRKESGQNKGRKNLLFLFTSHFPSSCC